MKFSETALRGAYIIEPEPRRDERGFFARIWCREEFERHGLNTAIAQCNLSYNKKQGTLRGLHYQTAPYQEAKLVACTRGAVFDVVVDLRRDSSTFGRWVAVELTADNRAMLYIPEGLAHGFVTLQDDTEVFYQMSQVYSEAHAGGLRWDDPALGIPWPPGEKIMSARDRRLPTLCDIPPESTRAY